MRDDSNHSWNVKQEYKITDDQYDAVQQSISNDKADTNLQYDLNTNNCTDWVIDTAALAGVTLPDATGTWPLGGGESPGPLGQGLAAQSGATVQPQNGDGSSGSSSGSSDSSSKYRSRLRLMLIAQTLAMKGCPVKQLLMLAVLVVIASAQTEGPGTYCILVAGVGCGNLIVHKTKRKDFLPDAATEKGFANEGLTFTFDANDILDGIVAAGNKGYKTDKGVSPGDKAERVLKAYGKAEKSGKMILNKGENEPIGVVGDQTLMYPGVLFVIAKGRVWAIEIVPMDKR